MLIIKAIDRYNKITEHFFSPIAGLIPGSGKRFFIKLWMHIKLFLKSKWSLRQVKCKIFKHLTRAVRHVKLLFCQFKLEMDFSCVRPTLYCRPANNLMKPKPLVKLNGKTAWECQPNKSWGASAREWSCYGNPFTLCRKIHNPEMTSKTRAIPTLSNNLHNCIMAAQPQIGKTNWSFIRFRGCILTIWKLTQQRRPRNGNFMSTGRAAKLIERFAI